MHIHTHMLTSVIAGTRQHAHRNHMQIHGPEGIWIIGGEAAEWVGQNQHLLVWAGTRFVIPFGIKQVCGWLRPVARRRPPTCPDLMVRPSRAKSSHRAPQLRPLNDPGHQDWVLSLTPTQGKQLEQERGEGKERGGRSVRGRAVPSGEELENGQESWPARPREDLVGCGRRA